MTEDKVLLGGIKNPLDTCHFWDAHKGVNFQNAKRGSKTVDYLHVHNMPFIKIALSPESA